MFTLAALLAISPARPSYLSFFIAAIKLALALIAHQQITVNSLLPHFSVFGEWWPGFPLRHTVKHPAFLIVFYIFVGKMLCIWFPLIHKIKNCSVIYVYPAPRIFQLVFILSLSRFTRFLLAIIDVNHSRLTVKCLQRRKHLSLLLV